MKRLLVIGVALLAPAVIGAGRAFGGRAVWTNTGPYDLDLTSIVTCPSDPLRIYADSIWTSVLRSDDGGQSWRDAGFDESAAATVSIAVDPRNADIVYAGDDRNLRKSTDGGESWEDLPANIGGSMSSIESVGSIFVSPGPPSVLYVYSGTLFQSTDEGVTFVPALDNGAYPISELFANPAKPSTLYGLGDGWLSESTDAGASWEVVFQATVGTGFVADLAAAPSDAAKVYMANGSKGEFKSSDGGATWKPLAGSPPARFLAVDPNDSETVYAAPASGQISRTTDGGATWAAFSSGLPTGETWTAVAATPSSPSTILAAGLDGLYELTDGFGLWSAERTGLAFDSANLLAVSSGENPTLYAGLSIDSGEGPAAIPAVGVEVKPSLSTAWSSTSLLWPGFEGRSEIEVPAIVADPVDPNRAWVSQIEIGDPTYVSGTLWRTTDAGGDWSAITPPQSALPFDSLAIRDGSPEVLLGGLAAFEAGFSGMSVGGGLRSSTDGGATWSDVGAGLPVQSVLSIAVSASDPGLIFVGLEGNGIIGTVSPPPMIYRTTDGGLTWSPTGPTFVSQTSVSSLIVDPRNPANVIACATIYQGNSILLRSLDGGATWASSPLSFYVSGLAIDPHSSSTLYAAAQSNGVLVSHDGGTTWNPFGTGLEGVWVNAIAIEPSGEVLHAATNSGVFDMELPSVVTVPAGSPIILGGRGRPLDPASE